MSHLNYNSYKHRRFSMPNKRDKLRGAFRELSQKMTPTSCCSSRPRVCTLLSMRSTRSLSIVTFLTMMIIVFEIFVHVASFVRNVGWEQRLQISIQVIGGVHCCSAFITPTLSIDAVSCLNLAQLQRWRFRLISLCIRSESQLKMTRPHTKHSTSTLTM